MAPMSTGVRAAPRARARRAAPRAGPHGAPARPPTAPDHHAFSANRSPYYTGFFFKIWDNLAGTVNRDACVCARCEVKAGRRSPAAWDKLKKPDYSVLLKPGFWMTPSKVE